jgi:hypothetical protein
MLFDNCKILNLQDSEPQKSQARLRPDQTLPSATICTALRGIDSGLVTSESTLRESLASTSSIAGRKATPRCFGEKTSVLGVKPPAFLMTTT